MRQTLIRIFLDEPWALWKVDPATGLPGPGAAVLLIVAAIGWTIWSKSALGGRRSWTELRSALPFWGGALLLVSVVPFPTASLPIFGYGFMLLVGFLAALKFAQRRAVHVGIDKELVFDAGFWVLVCGIVGARTFFLLQYGDRVFAGKQGGELITAVFNLSQGGIVLYGGVLGGAAAYFWFCWKKQVNALNLADVVTPSIFLGIGFGRIGCLLNGCCFGDRCELPWGISFPPSSIAWMELVQRGFLDRSAPATFPLHPSQIYSAINGFLLAWVMASFFPHRRRPGEVFALGCIIYPITRFVIEFLRGDEMGQLGTGLTISQLVSLGICTAGVALFAVLSRRPAALTKPSIG